MSTAHTRLRIGPGDHGRRMTIEEFLDADEEEGYRYELARGVVEVTEVPNDPHGQIEFNLVGLIHAFHRENPRLIHRCGGAGSFRLWVPEMESGRNPDVAIVLAGTPKDGRGRRRPSWAAEVVSSGAEARDRDYEAKRRDYLAYGLREYWIVDPALRQVTVLVRRESPDGPSWVERVFRGGEQIEGEILPGFAGTVGQLWAGAELDETDA